MVSVVDVPEVRFHWSPEALQVSPPSRTVHPTGLLGNDPDWFRTRQLLMDMLLIAEEVEVPPAPILNVWPAFPSDHEVSMFVEGLVVGSSLKCAASKPS